MKTTASHNTAKGRDKREWAKGSGGKGKGQRAKIRDAATDGTITNKMKTLKNHNPTPALDGMKVLQEFEQQEITMLQLLDKAQHVNINRIHIPVSITPLLKLKMGDVFGFIIAHHQRHFVQIENTLPPGPLKGECKSE